jgi:lipopolysaccharide export LptBFGC system permease protein LptF
MVKLAVTKRKPTPVVKPPRRLRPRQPRARRRGMVRIVDAYLFGEAFQLYIIGFGGFLLFLVVNQLFLEGDRLLNPNFPAKEILALIALNIPYYITMAIPIAVLFGTMMTMGRLAKDNEIDALFTNGIHLARLYMPFMVLSLINVLIVFAVNEAAVPRANAAAEAIYKKYPYLREQQDTESDPVIVSLPNGAFFAASFVDKVSGNTFYAVYDTLTKKGGESVDTEAPGPAAPPMSQQPAPGAQGAPSIAAPSPGATPPAPPQNGRPPVRPPAANGQVQPRPPPPPREPVRPPAAGEVTTTSAELGPAEGEAAPPPARPTKPIQPQQPVPPAGGGSSQLQPLPNAPLPAAKPPVESPAPAQPGLKMNVTAGEGAPDWRLYLSANGQIVQETLSITQPFEYVIAPDGLIARRDQVTNANLRLGIPLRDVFTDIKTPEELSREELQRQTEVKRQLGVSPAKDATDFYLKFSIPFACLFLSLVAMPLSLRAPRDERLLGLVITFVLVMSYYTVYYICKLMGYNEILPPIVAAWMQNVIYAGVAIVIFTVSRK